jgi:plastocyanin domain-containing protein
MILDIAINAVGILLIMMIIWWFWFSRPTVKSAGPEPIEIIVADGVYTPSHITLSAGQPATLRFMRKDPSPCAEKVIFDELGISYDLPINESIDITITPEKPGEYSFTCQMQMYRGMLMVKD